MQRGASGRVETISTVGETVRAFVPDPLPPAPPLELSGARQQRLESALLACGRLDGIAAMLPDPDLFLYTPMATSNSPTYGQSNSSMQDERIMRHRR